MILVDIYVPVIDKRYDFQLDENIPVELVIKEIAEMICRKEQCLLLGEPSELMLWGIRKKSKLNWWDTLYEGNIQSGECLMLV